MPLSDIISKQDVILSHMGGVVAGSWLEQLVSIDAFLVLAGSIIT